MGLLLQLHDQQLRRLRAVARRRRGELFYRTLAASVAAGRLCSRSAPKNAAPASGPELDRSSVAPPEAHMRARSAKCVFIAAVSLAFVTTIAPLSPSEDHHASTVRWRLRGHPSPVANPTWLRRSPCFRYSESCVTVRRPFSHMRVGRRRSDTVRVNLLERQRFVWPQLMSRQGERCKRQSAFGFRDAHAANGDVPS